MPAIPTIADELANTHVNANARKAWEEALAQPEFADVAVIWCYSASTDSDHRNGCCCDFMVTHTKKTLTRAQQVQMGNRIRAYFVKHAARLHVDGIIWNHQVTGFSSGNVAGSPKVSYRGPDGVARTYSQPDQHTDHNHVQQSGAPFKPLVPEKPIVWDGRSFPGAGAFHIGAKGSWVTLLGQRLVAHGWKGYTEGPGPVFTDTDQAGVQWAQRQQGFAGDDADGLPGPTTWAWLMADPAPKKEVDVLPRLVVSLNTGSGNTQGAIQDQSGDWFSPVATAEGDCLIYRFGSRGGDPLDSMLLKVAKGHEVHPVGWGVDRGELYLTWNEATNDVVHFDYKAGTTITKADTHQVHTFDDGNTRMAFSPGRDFCAIERLHATTEVYRHFATQAVREGREEPIGVPVTIQRDLKRRTVQGFTVVGDVLSVLTGRPSTKEPTRVSTYSFATGKPGKVLTLTLEGEAETIDGNRVGMKVGHGSGRRLEIWQVR